MSCSPIPRDLALVLGGRTAHDRDEIPWRPGNAPPLGFHHDDGRTYVCAQSHAQACREIALTCCELPLRAAGASPRLDGTRGPSSS